MRNLMDSIASIEQQARLLHNGEEGEFSSNIISLGLRTIAAEYGKDTANEVILEHDLGELGWSTQ